MVGLENDWNLLIVKLGVVSIQKMDKYTLRRARGLDSYSFQLVQRIRGMTQELQS